MMISIMRLPFQSKPIVAFVAVTMVASFGLGFVSSFSEAAEKYESRLSRLLIRKSDVYLPTRLVLGEEARFVIKAAPGNQVKLLMSPSAEGYLLPNGTALRVGSDAQILEGTVPETGILELKMDMPKDPELEGKVLYVDAVAGLSEESLEPMGMVDATGRRTGSNSLVIVKPAERGGPSILPNMPGLSPQVFNQLTQLGDVYSNKDDNRKNLLDNGDINRDRQMDQNPFIQRGAQPGIMPR